jgi:hypothetical protein
MINIKEILRSQYLASLEMLKSAIHLCPEALWENPQPKNKFWHVAYHALFYAHLYLQPAETDFIPWEKHQEKIGSLSWNLQDPAKPGKPYSKDDILEYLAFCQGEVKSQIAKLDLTSSESGFHWLPFSKLELQLYNIRHIQQHTGELCERLGSEAGIDADWVGLVHA